MAPERIPSEADVIDTRVPEAALDQPLAPAVGSTREALRYRIGGHPFKRAALALALGFTGAFGSAAASTYERSANVPMDATRTALADGLRRYSAPTNAPLEADVIDAAASGQGVVSLAGRDELWTIGQGDLDGNKVQVGGEHFWLHGVHTANGTVYYYLMRSNGGALYVGSSQDGGESGALARFDSVINTLKGKAQPGERVASL